MKKVRLYTAQTIRHFFAEHSGQKNKDFQFLTALIQEEIKEYIKNVETSFHLLSVGDLLLPVTVNDAEYKNAYVASNYVGFSLFEEWFSKKYPRLFSCKKPFLFFIKKFLKSVKINKMVMVNNWLVPTNLYPDISPEQIGLITQFLLKNFPDHLLVFRGINLPNHQKIFQSLKKNHCSLIGTRYVFFYNPKNKKEFSSKVHYHHRRDRRSIEREGYTIIEGEEIQKAHFPRLLELYRKVYCQYTAYSPLYTEKYLEMAVSVGFLKLVAVKKRETIDAVFGYYTRNHMMTVPFFGFDTDLPHSSTLYRMMLILIIDTAEREDSLLNDSSGAPLPKIYRGMRPFPEFTAIYSRHLPLLRRLFWKANEKILNRIVFPFLKKKTHSLITSPTVKR